MTPKATDILAFLAKPGHYGFELASGQVHRRRRAEKLSVFFDEGKDDLEAWKELLRYERISATRGVLTINDHGRHALAVAGRKSAKATRNCDAPGATQSENRPDLSTGPADLGKPRRHRVTQKAGECKPNEQGALF